MADISAETVAAAAAGDFEAMARVTEGTEAIVRKLAHKACMHVGRFDLTEDMEQTGRLTVWEAVRRFEGRAAFTTYIYQAVSQAIDDEMRRTVRPGVGHDSAKKFASALAVAEGDAAVAERLVAAHPDPKKRLSPDMARAARQAHEGPLSHSLTTAKHLIDSGDPDETIGDTIPDPYGYGVPEDLMEPRDIDAAQRRRNRDLAHALLALVTEKKRDVLKMTYGIAPEALYDDAGIAAELGLTESTIRVHRKQALTQLREKGAALLAADAA